MKGSEKTLSEKEKIMVEKIAKLPPELQVKILDQLTGAIMAMDILETKREDKAGAGVQCA